MGNNFSFYFICILCVVCSAFCLYRQFQMLQQNSYYPSRYIKWISDSFFEKMVALALSFCGICILYIVNTYIAMAALLLFTAAEVYSALDIHKKSIKKLVFTSRILRLFAAAIIFQIILVILVLTTVNPAKGIILCLSLFLTVFSPVLALLAYYITKPVEMAFSNYYISDAKKKIKEATGLKVIGITGSYGKTSTKFILSRILSEKFNVLSTPLSYNTTMGVVRTIREKLRGKTEIFVCEMGAKNIGDIKEICDIVNPDMAIISSVGAQHLETFKTVDNVFNTKFELYDSVKKNGGEVFVNIDSEGIRERLGDRECVSFGLSSADFYAENISYSPNGATFRIVGGGYDFPVTTKLLGKHNVINITGAAAIALKLGVTPTDIQYAVSRLEPTEHRLELKGYINGSLCLDDAYNANPEGCIEAVQVLASFKGMKKVIVTPGLVELGEEEYNFNYKLGLAAARICDIIILVGKKRAVPLKDAIDTTDFNKDNVYIVSSFKEAMEVYSRLADEKTVVLLENDLPDNYLN